MPRERRKTKGVSIRCPGLDGPCPMCQGLSVVVVRKPPEEQENRTRPQGRKGRPNQGRERKK